jgi:hypothetical protein
VLALLLPTIPCDFTGVLEAWETMDSGEPAHEKACPPHLAVLCKWPFKEVLNGGVCQWLLIVRAAIVPEAGGVALEKGGMVNGDQCIA